MRIEILSDKTITLTTAADHPALAALRAHADYAGEQADNESVRLRFMAATAKRRRALTRWLIRMSGETVSK